MAEMDPQTSTEGPQANSKRQHPLQHGTARWFAEHGVRVFPCRPGTKDPLYGCGWKDEATTDCDQIDRWWSAYPEANVGVPMKLNGLVAVDVDSHKPDCEWRAFAMGNDIPDTWETMTASGGTHYLFQDGGHSFAGKLRDGHGNVVKAVDIKHDGYVLAPGSVFIKDGEEKRYGHNGEADIAPAPDWLIKGAEPRPTSSHASTSTAPADNAPIPAEAARRAFADLPEKLRERISADAVHSTRSDVFMDGVGWMKRQGLQPHMIEAIFRLHPQGCAEKYLVDQGDRLAAEVLRAFERAEGRMDTSAIGKLYAAMAGQSGGEDGGGGKDDGVEPFALVSWDDASTIEPGFDFVEDTLIDNDLSVVYGKPGAGKTFFVLALGAHVAAGVPFGGFEVEQGGVLYIAAEGVGGIRKRVEALKQHYGFANIPLSVLPAPVDLVNAKRIDVLRLLKTIKDAGTKMGSAVRMIVVDTLSRCMAGGDENSPVDMTAFIGNCDLIRSATGAHVMVIHHTSKADPNRPRGHSALTGAAGTEIEVSSDDPRSLTGQIEVKKQRDLEPWAPRSYSLVPLDVGTNRRGKPVNSCALEMGGNAPPRAKGAGTSKKLTGAQLAVLATVTDLINRDGQDVSIAGTLTAKGMDGDALIEALRKAMKADGKTGQEVQPSKIRARKIDPLIKSGHLIEIDGSVCLPS